jgi:hypothetical protein
MLQAGNSAVRRAALARIPVATFAVGFRCLVADSGLRFIASLGVRCFLICLHGLARNAASGLADGKIPKCY